MTTMYPARGNQDRLWLYRPEGDQDWYVVRSDGNFWLLEGRYHSWRLWCSTLIGGELKTAPPLYPAPAPGVHDLAVDCLNAYLETETDLGYVSTSGEAAELLRSLWAAPDSIKTLLLYSPRNLGVYLQHLRRSDDVDLSYWGKYANDLERFAYELRLKRDDGAI